MNDVQNDYDVRVGWCVIKSVFLHSPDEEFWDLTMSFTPVQFNAETPWPFAQLGCSRVG